MIQTVNLHDFRQAFHDCGRGEQFSHEALGLIFEYFEDLERDTGQTYDLDIIAICCEVSEMTADEVREAYNIDASFPDDTNGDCDDVINYLEHNTSVIGQTDNTIIFFQF
jgi:hypothetical protein